MDTETIKKNCNSDLLMSLSDLLKKGDENIKCCLNKDLVLIIGTTGTGKSTLAQFLAGNLEKLHSKSISNGSSFIIVDEDDVISNNSTILSKTIFPRLVEDQQSDMIYCDCPGFSDTRSAAQDIAANYFINRVVGDAHSRAHEFLSTVSEKGHRVDPSCVPEGIVHVTEFFHHSSKWYSFLCNLYSTLTDYRIQINPELKKIDNQFFLTEENVRFSNISLGSNIYNIFEDNSLGYSDVKDITLNKPKIKALEQILNITLKDDFESITDDRLLITGRFVLLSRVNHLLLKENLRFIDILTFNKVFIDSNIDGTGKELQLTIIAPTWEIIGEPQITLDGKSSIAHDPPQAQGEGEGGSAGQPGGAAGIFVAIGNQFINDQHLRVSVVEGRGGKEQNGGKGSDGQDGQDPDIPDWEDNDTQMKRWEERGFRVHVVVRHIIPIIRILERQTVDVTGTSGTSGANGGNGGRGGYGGPAGRVIIINTNGPQPQFIVTCRTGEEGLPGAGGAGGRGGRNGLRVYSHRFDVTNGNRRFERQSTQDMGACQRW